MVDISKLSKAEKRVLYDQLAFDLKGAEDLTPEDRVMWDHINDALKTSYRSPLAKFIDSYGKRKYREACAAVRAYVDEACADKTKKPVREAVTAEVLRCLASSLKERGLPYTPTVLLNSLAVLEHAVECRFPGYKAARMLDRIAMRRDP